MKKSLLIHTLALLLGAALPLAASGGDAPPPSERSPASTLESLFHEYLETALPLSPMWATQLGDHRFDHLLDDMSAAARARRTALSRETLARLAQHVDPSKLPAAAGVDFELIGETTRRGELQAAAATVATALREHQRFLEDELLPRSAMGNAILDHKMHCTPMTDDEAVRFLTEDVLQSEGAARLKTIRAKQSSTQLSTYFAGRTAIMHVRNQLQRELGGAFDLGRFHEALLEQGSVPVKYLADLVRARLQQPHQ